MLKPDPMLDLPLAITRLLWLVDGLTDDQYLRAAVLYDQITARCPAPAFADALELIIANEQGGAGAQLQPVNRQEALQRSEALPRDRDLDPSANHASPEHRSSRKS